MRTIRASEIGTYLFCKRAWWYQGKGIQSENQADFAMGNRMHYGHGRQVFLTGLMRLGAYVLFLTALILFVIYWLLQVL